MSAVELQALQIIKSRTRALGVTQAKIAQDLGVSLPTVKRWWAGKGLSLSVISNLAALIGVSLSRLFLEVEGGSQSYSYTVDQEKMLAQHPQVLALFDLLVSGENVGSVSHRYEISEEDMFKMLLKLDRAGLIELHEKNKFKLSKGGEPQWIVGGQLSVKYRRRMIEALLSDHAKSETSFFIHNYLPEDVILLKGKMKELENLMLTCNVRGNLAAGNKKSFGSYFAIKEFEWDLRNYLKK